MSHSLARAGLGWRQVGNIYGIVVDLADKSSINIPSLAEERGQSKDLDKGANQSSFFQYFGFLGAVESNSLLPQMLRIAAKSSEANQDRIHLLVRRPLQQAISGLQAQIGSLEEDVGESETCQVGGSEGSVAFHTFPGGVEERRRGLLQGRHLLDQVVDAGGKLGIS